MGVGYNFAREFIFEVTSFLSHWNCTASISKTFTNSTQSEASDDAYHHYVRRYNILLLMQKVGIDLLV